MVAVRLAGASVSGHVPGECARPRGPESSAHDLSVAYHRDVDAMSQIDPEVFLRVTPRGWWLYFNLTEPRSVADLGLRSGLVESSVRSGLRTLEKYGVIVEGSGERSSAVVYVRAVVLSEAQEDIARKRMASKRLAPPVEVSTPPSHRQITRQGEVLETKDEKPTANPVEKQTANPVLGCILLSVIALGIVGYVMYAIIGHFTESHRISSACDALHNMIAMGASDEEIVHNAPVGSNASVSDAVKIDKECPGDMEYFQAADQRLGQAYMQNYRATHQPSGPQGSTGLPSYFSSRGVTKDNWIAFKLAATLNTYTTSNSPPVHEFLELGHTVEYECGQISAGATTVGNLIEDDMSSGASSSHAHNFWLAAINDICTPMGLG